MIPLLLLAGALDGKSAGSAAPSCDGAGARTLFLANFETDAVGSVPPPAGTGLYGPTGATLSVSAGAGAVVVENSATLGARALRVTRSTTPTSIEAIFGDAGDTPCCGIYNIKLRLLGDPVPEQAIASPSLSVVSLEGRPAVGLKAYGGKYYQFVGGTYQPIVGSYNPATPHVLLITLDLDTHRYSVCINSTWLVSHQPFVDPAFHLRNLLRIQLAPTVTEGFASELVIDEIRVTK